MFLCVSVYRSILNDMRRVFQYHIRLVILPLRLYCLLSGAAVCTCSSKGQASRKQRTHTHGRTLDTHSHARTHEQAEKWWLLANRVPVTTSSNGCPPNSAEQLGAKANPTSGNSRPRTGARSWLPLARSLRILEAVLPSAIP